MRRKETPLTRLRQWRMKQLRERMKWHKQANELKAKVQENSNSLLWVWEFSKKAVLICFLFYVGVQLYSMASMWRFMDFSALPTLIEKTADLTERCVFAYLIKAGLENIGKIWFTKLIEKSKPADQDDTPVG